MSKLRILWFLDSFIQNFLQTLKYCLILYYALLLYIVWQSNLFYSLLFYGYCGPCFLLQISWLSKFWTIRIHFFQVHNFQRIDKIIILVPVLLGQGLRPLGANKTGFNLIFFHLNICGKLSIIQCDKLTTT